MRTAPSLLTPRVLGRLAVVGAGVGPAVDALHNQALLTYDVAPLVIGTFKSSWLVPPLLAVAYVVLGAVLPAALVSFFGEPARQPLASAISPSRRAVLAVTSTAIIIKASDVLAVSPVDGGVSAALLWTACAAQWAVLDGAPASALLAVVASIGGPLSELCFTYLGCWHYLSPDYWPLSSLGLGATSGASWAGLASITAPCYAAVTTDAIALGRAFATERDASRS